MSTAKPPIYFRAREMNDPQTGDVVLALVPASHTDAQQPAWARLRPGDRRRGQLTAPRNPKFHRFVHALASVASQNIEDLSHLDPHACIKRLQAEAGVECDLVMLDASTVWEQVTEAVCAAVPEDHIRRVMGMIGDLLAGQSLPVKWPRSIAFDSLDEDRFKALARAICIHLSRRYWPTCTPEQIADMAEMHIDGQA